MKKIFLKLLLLLLIINVYKIDGTNSYLVDNETSINNIIQAATWDSTPPLISNIFHLIATPGELNDVKAIITWSTNENATSNLEYSIDAGVTWTPLLPDDTTADNTSHSREITGLSTTITYTYHVKSKDLAGNEATSPEKSFTTGNMNPSEPVSSDIVINEFLPDPAGVDDASMPSGEWAELYNRGGLGGSTLDLTGWSISSDSNPGYKMPLTLTNTITSDSGTTGLNIAPGEFFAVYRNGDPNFSLNHAGDTVRLFDTSGEVDSHAYIGSEVAENKSIARFPDGFDTWFDPIPTAGGPNKLEAILQSVDVTPTPAITPTLQFDLINDKKAVRFTVKNLDGNVKLSYELTYDAYDAAKGVIGNDVDISKQIEYSKEIDLATCSSGVCTYDENVHNLQLKVTLINLERKETIIEKNL